MGTDHEYRLQKLGVSIPKILLPKRGTDLKKWAVVACDQYTSEPEYWKKVEEFVGSAPSTLNLIFPEVYLEDSDYDKRIDTIQAAMKEYIDKNILVEEEPAFFLIERLTDGSAPRWGLIAAIDLECYDYSNTSRSLIRATEGTIEERIPPRKKIREKAALELPHIMVLIDDEQRKLIEPLSKKCGSYEKIYDFELMMGGGHVRAYRIDSSDDFSHICEALEFLADPDLFEKKHDNKDVLLFAMGDGNHSLATAKAVWEDIKAGFQGRQEDLSHHPARWALVEIENIYDNALEFEPIHRIVFGGSFDLYRKELERIGTVSFEEFDTLEKVYNRVVEASKKENDHYIGYLDARRRGVFSVEQDLYTIAAATAQKAVDSLVEQIDDCRVDYIHGEETTAQLGAKPGNFGILLPPLDKHDFFRTVVHDGALPRKTFSMGEAYEKRYYIEARKILPS